jgi:glutamate N-acetyltransferase/amino-acid N-acetyltransferase
MAVAFPELSQLEPVSGIRLGSAAAGMRKAGRLDVVVIECAPGTRASALFTRNRFSAAPVAVAKAHLSARLPRALLINTGIANAGTGRAGERDAQTCCRALAEQLGCAPDAVLPFSTGVIGEPLPVARLIGALPGCVAALSEQGWIGAAHGIMTTDTRPKASSRRVVIGKRTIAVTGIAKGSGMIRPNMATMLAFVATDATAGRSVLKQCLRTAVDNSFNRITVDGDTSTNDAVVLLATGKAGSANIDRTSGRAYAALLGAVTEVCRELAHMIVRDGEGASKFITIEVTRGASQNDCLEVAYAIAHSPLVKTAFFASDPNWGRILAAIGRAPIRRLDSAKVNIYLNDVCIVKHGALAPEYTEAKGLEAMKPADIWMRVELGAGRHAAQVWTCDLSHEYVRINAEYRT